MCGLIAYCGLPGSVPDINDALGAIRHRGPDDSGIFVSEVAGCVLGHARLAIIDLSPSGHQPMRDPDGGHVIVYNGEIYNFRELKANLEKLHGQILWNSSSDTEVILRGFVLEGPAFLRRLNGIFAIAIHDLRTQELHTLRDPLGVKPLFLAETSHGMVFGSEIKGLLRIPGVDAGLRRMSVAEQLAFMYVPEPNTPYEAISKAVPGVLQTWRHGKLLNSSRLFDDLTNPLPVRTEHEWVESFREAFSTAVRRQLVSDAPVSIMLSGGLDSSAVAMEAVRGGATFKTAYTISYSPEDMRLDQQSDDLRYARLVAERLGLDLQVIPADRNLLSLLPEISPFLEDGIADPAALNTFLICRAARGQGVKVMLTGQGADEYLAGYRRHRAFDVLGRMPGWQQAILRVLSSGIPPSVPGRFNSLARRIRRLGQLLRKNPADRIVDLFTWIDQEALAGMFLQRLEGRIGTGIVDLFGESRSLGEVEALLRVDQAYDLRSLNLTYCDRLSMAVGVEARVPFLDFDLVRLMNSLPPSMKLRGAEGKYVLKKAMEGLLPREVIYREKAGFGLPMRAWLRQESELMSRCLNPARLESEGLLRVSAIQNLQDEQFRGQADHANVLFSLMCFQLSLEASGGAGVRQVS